ncbi:hypothetical protein [Pseudomonas lutea]|uniref:hypothetical protein n=1 Tax=Pseudomonas lutea TaxID=243924 RepID=UPI003B8477B3
MAFLPLFIDPNQHQGVVTFALLAATVSCLTFLYGLIVIFLTHFARRKLGRMNGLQWPYNESLVYF